jgi:hypothetical protein
VAGLLEFLEPAVDAIPSDRGEGSQNLARKGRDESQDERGGGWGLRTFSPQCGHLIAAGWMVSAQLGQYAGVGAKTRTEPPQAGQRAVAGSEPSGTSEPDRQERHSIRTERYFIRRGRGS